MLPKPFSLQSNFSELSLIGFATTAKQSFVFCVPESFVTKPRRLCCMSYIYATLSTNALFPTHLRDRPLLGKSLQLAGSCKRVPGMGVV